MDTLEHNIPSKRVPLAKTEINDDIVVCVWGAGVLPLTWGLAMFCVLLFLHYPAHTCILIATTLNERTDIISQGISILNCFGCKCSCTPSLQTFATVAVGQDMPVTFSSRDRFTYEFFLQSI